MKQELKKLIFLFLSMGFFTSSQEKTCVNRSKCVAVPIVAETNIQNQSDTDADSDMSIMPISQFIIVQ